MSYPLDVLHLPFLIGLLRRIITWNLAGASTKSATVEATRSDRRPRW